MKERNQAVPALIQALRSGPNDLDTGDGIIETRSAIATALGEIGDKRAIPALIELLRSKHPVDGGSYASKEPAAHSAAIEALGLFGPDAKEALPYIVPYLQHRPISSALYKESWKARVAAEALAKIGDERAIQPLTEALSNSAAAAAAAEALVSFGDEAAEAQAYLTPALKQAWAEVQKPITAKDIGINDQYSSIADPVYQVRIDSVRWERLNQAKTIARAAGDLNATGAVPVLIEMLVELRIAADVTYALSKFGKEAKGATPKLEALLEIPGPWIMSWYQNARRGAVTALGAIGTSEALQVLKRYIPDKELGDSVLNSIAQSPGNEGERVEILGEALNKDRGRKA